MIDYQTVHDLVYALVPDWQVPAWTVLVAVMVSIGFWGLMREPK